jgi:transcriptional regulator with GAF, ATPase, and Fis domain
MNNQTDHKVDFHRIIGASPQMRKICAFISKVADTESTVLITGESGTGKEVVARTIHENSSRRNAPFVPVNCAAIPRDLIESELFGHEKGAFTGATRMRVGRFELADGGTLFLDEIGDLHPSLQVKLLRILQEKEFERVGGTKTVKVNARILAATNKDLAKATREGSFREDLFYRLNVIPLNIPPLRKRKEDILHLARYFIGIFSMRKGREPLAMHPDTVECICNYSWPGNVRELENMMERIVILDDDGIITREDIPEHIFTVCRNSEEEAAADNNVQQWSHEGVAFPQEGVDLNAVLEEIEKRIIIQALERAGGVKKKAATLLGLNRTTLLEKLKKKGIDLATPELTVP